MNDFGSGPGMIPHTGSLNQTGGPGCLCRTCSLEKQISFLKARHDALRASHRALMEALNGLLADVIEYQTINHLGGEANHWQVFARAAIATAEEIAKCLTS